MLLKTPTSNLGSNGGSQHPDKRKDGGHGPTLADEVEFLLPTPMSQRSGRNRSASAGAAVRWSLDSVDKLLPTPSAADGLGGHERRGGERGDELLLAGLVKTLPTPTSRDWKGANQRGDDSCLPGAITSLQSDGGKPSTGLPPLRLFEDG